MTPEQWIGHKAFRTITSHRWPPTEVYSFASWLQHRDGTLVFYIRGLAKLEGKGQLADAIAKECFGYDSCHRCVYEFALGRLHADGTYSVHWSTTQRLGKENPWGELCRSCRECLAMEALQSAGKRLKDLGFHPTSTAAESMWRKAVGCE